MIEVGRRRVGMHRMVCEERGLKRGHMDDFVYLEN